MHQLILILSFRLRNLHARSSTVRIARSKNAKIPVRCFFPQNTKIRDNGMLALAFIITVAFRRCCHKKSGWQQSHARTGGGFGLIVQ